MVLAVVAAVAMPCASALITARADLRQTPYYPNKPLRMIVPLAPGGGSDIVGRIQSVALTEYGGSRWWWTIARVRAARSEPRSSPVEFERFLDAEITKWAKVIRAARIRAE